MRRNVMTKKQTNVKSRASKAENGKVKNMGKKIVIDDPKNAFLPLSNPAMQREIQSMSPETLKNFMNSFNTLYIEEE